MSERNGRNEKDGRRIGSGVLSGDYRFTGVDVVLVVLVMALLVGATWRMLVLTPEKKVETVNVTVRFRVAEVPDGAEGRVVIGDNLYIETGEALGSVVGITYAREDGETMRAYMNLHLEARKCKDGYRVACGNEGKELLLSIGREYLLHTRNFGASARCLSVTEDAS